MGISVTPVGEWEDRGSEGLLLSGPSTQKGV